MDSSNSFSSEAPFGYSWRDAPPPPEEYITAPGQSLLNQQESSLYDTWFNTIAFNRTESSPDFPLNPNDKSNFGWLFAEEEPAPTFHGATTSLAQPGNQHPMPGQIGQSSQFNLLEEPMYVQRGIQSETSPDGFRTPMALNQDALSKIHRTGLRSGFGSHVHNGFHSISQSGLFATNKLSHTIDPKHPRLAYKDELSFDAVSPGSYTQRSAASFGGDNSRPADATSFNSNVSMNDVIFSSSRVKDLQSQIRDKATEINWGSDASFYDHGFVAPPHQNTEEEVTQDLLTRLSGLERQTSAANTQPSSPILQKQKRYSSAIDSTPLISESGNNSVELNVNEENNEAGISPTKRRKVKSKAEETDEQGDDFIRESIQSQSKRKKPSSATNLIVKKPPIYKETPTKSRKSFNRKPGRDNLTEAQKRSNHILSEQRRRDLMTRGFDELEDIIPGLKGGGFSRSAKLVATVKWLNEMLDGNARLKTELFRLDGDSGL